jgi:hypothetical protein
MSTYSAPVSLLPALSRPYLVNGIGFRRLSPAISDYWCLLPVRFVMVCNVDAKEHTKSTAGSNHMDPFHYIHLTGAKADIGDRTSVFMSAEMWRPTE